MLEAESVIFFLNERTHLGSSTALSPPQLCLAFDITKTMTGALSGWQARLAGEVLIGYSLQIKAMRCVELLPTV